MGGRNTKLNWALTKVHIYRQVCLKRYFLNIQNLYT